MKTGIFKIPCALLCTLVAGMSVNAAPGLIHKWAGEGDANDSVGTANGTIVSFDTNVSAGVTFAPGQVGQAFNIDGNGMIDCGTTNVAAFGDHDFAIAFWMKVNGGNSGSLVTKSDGIGYDIGFSDGSIRCYLQSSNDSVSLTSLSRVDDGNFHHVVVERNTTNLYVFLDGVLAGESISTQIIDMPEIPYVLETNQLPLLDDMGNQLLDADGNGLYTNEVDVASQPASFQIGAGFVGLIDEVEVYPRALTPFEVFSVSHPGVGLAIIDQPLNQRGLAGRPILLHTLAVGYDPITYQWQFNGFDIPGAISNNLVLDSPQTFDSGTYTVLVSNPTNDLTSHPATLTITNLATPTAGLIARWSGEGTANDSIGGHNGVTSNIKYVPGVLGTAFQFNGTSSVRCGNVIGNIGTHDFTIDFWMQTTTPAPPGEGGMPVLGQRPICSWTDCMDFRLRNSGSTFSYMQVELGDHRDLLNPPFNASGPQSAATSFHLDDGVFHHVAAVRSSNVMSLYIDGTFVSSSQSREPCLLANSGSFDMGINVCGGTFKGALDEVEVFNRALSDSEIYNDYSPNPTLTLVRQPKTTSTIENTPAAMTVSAAGADPITFQWRLNGTDIAGATASAYSLASAQLSDAGLYTVMVSNPVTALVSAPAQLSVTRADSILPGLVDRWSADGDYVDLMGNSTLFSAQNRFAPGVSGQAWKFDGNIDVVAMFYNTGQLGYDDFTWSFWLRYEKDGTLFASIPAYRFSATGGLIQVQFGDGWRDFTTNWFIMGDTNAGSFITNAPVPINDGQFHQVAISREGVSNLFIYIDGTLSVQTAIPPFYLSDDWGFAFCDDYGRYPRFAGEIDETELYNRALSSDEVSSLYTKYAKGPRGDYALQELTAALGSPLTLHTPTVNNVSGAISYQWTLNGVPIAGATSADYTVGSVDASSAGIYAVTITTADGSISSPMARVSIQLAPGTYNGLFYLDNDTTDDSAGYITLTLDITQTYSATIMQKAKTYKGLTGKFSGANSVLQVNRGTGKSPLTIELSGINSNKVNGVVHDATRKIPLEAHRAIYDASHQTPQAGSYTVQMAGISSPTAPNGHGFGNLTIASDGKITFIANLADDVTVSQGTMYAKAGVWPLFVPAYGGRGSVMGWMSFTNKTGSIAAGTLRWIKAPAPLSKNYKKGFATRIPALASTFIAPTAGLGIGLANSAVVADGAKIYNAVNDQIISTNKNTIYFTQIGTKQKGTLTVNPSKGRFSGTFFDPVRKRSSTVRGIVMQDQAYAAGYFISSNLSGRILLQHN